jgi:hypothetical protein
VVLALVDELRKQKIEISEKSLENGLKMFTKHQIYWAMVSVFRKSIDYL